MGSITIPHVIGTTTLILVFIGVTMFYTISYFSLQNEALARQLQEAADYVSSSLIDLVSLSFINPADQLLIKSLDLPQNIGSDFYILTLIEETNPITQEKVLLVKAYFSSKPSVYRESLLPWSTVKIFNGTGGPTDLNPCISISSSVANAVIWAWKQDAELTIGLGER
ncbi:MAG: hypothetical protein QXX08_02930 [Candidatus Bathyarchaeia archaeon]